MESSKYLIIPLLLMVISTEAEHSPFHLKQFFMTFYNPRLLNLPPVGRYGRQVEAQSYCDLQDPSFEILENFQINAPHDIIREAPYVNTVTDCIGECQKEPLCHSVEITEGVCTMYSISYDDSPAKFEWSTIKGLHVVAQRRCSPAACTALWQSEVVPSYRLNNHTYEVVPDLSRKECTERCLKDPSCESANYNTANVSCELNSENRQSLSSNTDFAVDVDTFYIENNCKDDSGQVCTFEKHENVIPYTFDSFYLNARSEDECKAKCTANIQNCRSFTFGLFANIPMCFLTHQTNYERMGQDETFCALANVTTNELKSCYSFHTECIEEGLSIKVDSTREFNGQIHPPQSPDCRIEVNNNNEFFFVIPYNEPLCNISTGPDGNYETEIQIQHYRPYITSPDFIWNAVFDCSSPPTPATTEIGTTEMTTTDYITEIVTTEPTTMEMTTTTTDMTTTDAVTYSPVETTTTDMMTTTETTGVVTEMPTTTDASSEGTRQPEITTTDNMSSTDKPTTYRPIEQPTDKPVTPSTESPMNQTTTCPTPVPTYTVQSPTCPAPPVCAECKQKGPPQMGITVLNRNGTQLTEDPRIGDPVALAFFTSEPDSPFVPRIVDVAAINVADGSTFQMLDKRGCPTPPFVAGKIYQFAKGLYLSDFNAFTFNQADTHTIQYRSQVEWVWQKAAPPICDNNDEAPPNDQYISPVAGNKI